METCSSCYFALLCSESCKNQHFENGCITLGKHQNIINMQNHKNNFEMKNNIGKKSYVSSMSSNYSKISSTSILSSMIHNKN